MSDPAGPHHHRWARFDDLRAGSALLCPPPYRVVTARRPDEVLDALRQVQTATDAGSWAYGYVGYEAAAGLDRPPTGIATEPVDLPLLWFGLCEEPTPTPVVRPPTGDDGLAWRWRADWTDAQHATAVQLVREQIAAGTTYQVNLTDRLRARDVDGDLLEFYGRLASAQCGAYNAYLDLGRHVIASASPELFFEWSGDLVRTRPMKGTAARSPSIDEDRERARILRSSPKELAENLMIVDLLRSDLGRIARTGSVKVTELFTVESYPTVWQLTSEVTARIPPVVGLGDLFEALFPCGSRHRSPQTSHHAIDTGTGADSPRCVLRCDRSAGSANRWVPGPVQRGHPDGRGRPGNTGSGVRRGWRNHLGLGPRRRAGRALCEGSSAGPSDRRVEPVIPLSQEV